MNATRAKYPVHDELVIPEAMLASWQKTVDLMAEVIQVPAGLVMRVHPRQIEVLIRSSNPGNVYHPGEKAELDTGLYCETVMDRRSELLVADARIDPLWADNPDIKLGMYSYCGLPLTWPDGHLFGTICVLDERGNAYSEIYRRLLEQFRDSVQHGLATVWENRNLQRAQLELTHARAEAEAASRAKSSFLSAMSHELRTPMNAILGMTGLALLQASDARLIKQLTTVETASRHLLDIINDVLEISKIEARRVTLLKQDFMLASVVDKVRSLTAEQADAKKLDLRFDLAPPLERLRLNGDELRLVEILVNYVGNAIKFSDRGEVRVSAAIVEESADTLLLRCEVQDSGIGISPEDQARLFNAFVQSDSPSGRRYGGTGLGLAINKGLALLMGGEVGVRSAIGQGSTFWFTARIGKREPAVEAAPIAATPTAAALLRARHGGRRVLLAEDDPINQSVCRDLLDYVGLQVDLASDGEQAVERARRGRYDLILMDVQMPVLDGLEATQAIRALPGAERTPILAFTANAFAEDQRRCLDAGMNDHVSKPVAPQQFFGTLLKWLDAPSPGG